MENREEINKGIEKLQSKINDDIALLYLTIDMFLKSKEQSDIEHSLDVIKKGLTDLERKCKVQETIVNLLLQKNNNLEDKLKEISNYTESTMKDILKF